MIVATTVQYCQTTAPSTARLALGADVNTTTRRALLAQPRDWMLQLSSIPHYCPQSMHSL